MRAVIGSWVLTLAGPTAPANGGGLHVVIRTLDRMLRPAPAIVPIQLLARELAVARGRVPGTLAHATTVTTRE